MPNQYRIPIMEGGGGSSEPLARMAREIVERERRAPTMILISDGNPPERASRSHSFSRAEIESRGVE